MQAVDRIDRCRYNGNIGYIGIPERWEAEIVVFQRAKSGSAKKSTLVAEQILLAIAKGEYAPGDRLPSERKLAEEMEVSRIPVREALSALQITGVVESVTGDGTYVRSTGGLPGVKPAALMILEKDESPFEALRARKTLESGIVVCLIDIARTQPSQKLEQALEHMEKAVEEKSLDSYFAANRDFHLTLARITQNSIIERSAEYLLSIMDQPLWVEAVQKHFLSFEHVKEYARRHRRIYEAIRAEDKTRALIGVRDHYDRTAEEVKECL